MIAIGLTLLVLALLGAPLFVVIAGSALAGFYATGVDLAVVPIEFYRIAETPVLLAIPLFTFSGYVLGESNAPARLVRLSRALLGWAPGGLAIIALVACALFTAFTGASGVTIVALGALLYPALLSDGYREQFSLGLVTISGSLGLLFAPSLPLILYGVIVQQLGVGRPVSIDELFLAGILPGTLILLLLAVYSGVRGRAVRTDPFEWREAAAALRACAWELPLPAIVLGGIYGGYLVVSEGAAVTALYVIVVEVAILREVRFRDLPRVMRNSMVLVGGILVIIGASLASTNYVIDVELPMRLFETIRAHITDRFTFLLVLNLFLLLLGTMLDIFSALVIMVPLLLPLAVGYGVDPLHLGIIFLTNLGIGYFTPPVGMNLFIASYRFDRPIIELYRATLPFLLLMLIALAIITYWPALTLFLPARLGAGAG